MSENVTVYAVYGPDPNDDGQKQFQKAFFEELKKGKARFGWGAYGHVEKHWGEYNHKKRNVRFLQRIRPGDWICYINVPDLEKFIPVRVVKGYEYDEAITGEKGDKDFGHFVTIDPAFLNISPNGFDRREPDVKSRLKLNKRGYHWRLNRNAFFETLVNLILK